MLVWDILVPWNDEMMIERSRKDITSISEHLCQKVVKRGKKEKEKEEEINEYLQVINSDIVSSAYGYKEKDQIGLRHNVPERPTFHQRW